MRILLSFVFLLLSAVNLTAAGTDFLRVADCIRLVEGNDIFKPGRHGERGPWQHTYAVWRQHSASPFWWASSPLPEHQAEALRVTLAHLRWLETVVENPTPYRLAIAWNAGPTAANHAARIPERAFVYARRFQNLFDDCR